MPSGGTSSFIEGGVIHKLFTVSVEITTRNVLESQSEITILSQIRLRRKFLDVSKLGLELAKRYRRKCRGRFSELDLAGGLANEAKRAEIGGTRLSSLVGTPERGRIIEMDRRTARDEPLRKMACDF